MSEAPAIEVRKALLSDVAPLLELINGYASQGIMLPRTEFELSENIRDFTVAVQGGSLLGCGALHFYGPHMGEIRSLAVNSERTNLGIGKRLVRALESEAVAHGLRSLFAFTYIPGFFGSLDFVEIERQQLPSKVWRDCLRCPKLQCCDEIAMQKLLVPAEETAASWEESAAANGAVLMPTVAHKKPL
jgi:amino-acid N-acetyltransferase